MAPFYIAVYAALEAIHFSALGCKPTGGEHRSVFDFLTSPAKNLSTGIEEMQVES
jgi:hypothetical protein